MGVWLIMEDDLIKITPEKDFGIWDEEYVCKVRLKKGQYIDVELSSRTKDIDEAKKWQEKILKKTNRINNTDIDLKEFIVKHL